jgi:hypothetical protein
VGHLVGQRAVDVVADPREHRDVEARHCPGDALRVERGEVRRGAAAPDQQHEVDPAGRHRPQTPCHRPRGSGALHTDVGAQHREPDARAGELVEHVVLGRRARAGHQAQPQRHGRTDQRRLPIQQALGRQDPQQPGPVVRQSPQRERRVDVRHLQLQPAAPVPERDPAPQPHLRAVGHAHGAARVGQAGVDPAPGGVEQHHRQ